MRSSMRVSASTRLPGAGVWARTVPRGATEGATGEASPASDGFEKRAKLSGRAPVVGEPGALDARATELPASSDSVTIFKSFRPELSSRAAASVSCNPTTLGITQADEGSPRETRIFTRGLAASSAPAGGVCRTTVSAVDPGKYRLDVYPICRPSRKS